MKFFKWINYLLNKENSFSKLVPFDLLLNDFVVINKNNALQSTFKVKNHDLNFFTESEVREKIRQYNRALKLLPNGFMIHYEVQRKKVKGYITKNLKKAPIPTQAIDYVRKEEFEKKDFFQCDYYITLTYHLNTDSSEIMNILSSKSSDKKERLMETALEKYNFFTKKCIEFLDSLKYVTTEIEVLKNEELMGYLYSTLNPEFFERKKCPTIESKIALDNYLSHSSFEFGKESKINDYYLKTLSIIIMPDSLDPLFLREVEELDFEFRMSMRYIILSNEEAKNSIENYRRYHEFKTKKEGEWVFEAVTKTSNGKVDKAEIEKINETEEALYELKDGGISYGYYTFSIIVWDKNLKILEDKIRKIKEIFTRNDFIAEEDIYNTKGSFLGAIPGNITDNIRMFTLNTFVLSGLFPNSTLFRGEEKNEHLNENVPLAIGKTKKNDIFYLNLHIKDNGNAFVVGPIGTGKSVFLIKVAEEFAKFEDSQIFYFDVGGSSRITMECMGANFFDLGDENNNVSFQPLATIDTKAGKEFSNIWILTILEQENVLITADIKDRVWEALTTLSEMPKNRRTLSNFEFIVKNEEIKKTIKLYTIEGPYGKYFDSNVDNFMLSDFQVFEIGKIIRYEKLVSPILQYLFYKIEYEKLNGRPTAIIVDEARYNFKNKQFVNTFEDWSRNLRKKNAIIVFATQNLKEVLTTEEIIGAISGFKTKILLPDSMAGNDDFSLLYRKIGLNGVEINEIMESEPKKEYIYSSPLGTSKFELNLTPLELAYVGSTSLDDQLKFIDLTRGCTTEEKNLKWIAYKFGYDSKEYKLIKKIVGGKIYD